MQIRKLRLFLRLLLRPNLELFPSRRLRFGHSSVVVWGHHFSISIAQLRIRLTIYNIYICINIEHVYTWLRTINNWMMRGIANLCFLVPAFPLSVEDDIYSLQGGIF